jgi:DNA-binding MarR family transcriptional regulator
VLDRLEAKGLIRRTPVADDRRSTRICLTAKGDRLFQKTFASHIAFLRPFFQRALTSAEADQLRTLLLRLQRSLHGTPGT